MKEIYKQALDKWGLEKQLDVLAEECLECALAVHHFKRMKIGKGDLISEMVDAKIMLEQIKGAFSLDLNDEKLFREIEIETARKLLGKITREKLKEVENETGRKL